VKCPICRLTYSHFSNPTGGTTAILNAAGAVTGGVNIVGAEDGASIAQLELLRFDDMGAFVEGRPPVVPAAPSGPMATGTAPPVSSLTTAGAHHSRSRSSYAGPTFPVARNSPEFLRTVLFCNHLLRSHPDASQIVLARPAAQDEGSAGKEGKDAATAQGMTVALCRSVMGQQTFVQLQAPKGSSGPSDGGNAEEAALRLLESHRFRQELRKRHKLWIL